VVERGISVSNNQFHMRTLNLDLYRKCAVLFIQENLIDVPIVERDYDNSVESDDADELLFCYNISKSEITTISRENYMKEFINGDSRDEISMVDEPKTRKFLIPDIDDLRFNELDELINVHNEHMSEFVEEKLQKFDFERIDVMINYHGLGDAYGSLVSSVRKSGSIRNFSILSYCEIIWKGRVAFRYHVTRSDVSHFVIVIPVSSHLLGYSVISRFLDEEDDLKFVVSEEENGWSNPCSCFGVSTWFCGDVECPFQDAISCNSRIDYLTRDGRSWISVKTGKNKFVWLTDLPLSVFVCLQKWITNNCIPIREFKLKARDYMNCYGSLMSSRFSSVGNLTYIDDSLADFDFVWYNGQCLNLLNFRGWMDSSLYINIMFLSCVCSVQPIPGTYNYSIVDKFIRNIGTRFKYVMRNFYDSVEYEKENCSSKFVVSNMLVMTDQNGNVNNYNITNSRILTSRRQDTIGFLYGDDFSLYENGGGKPMT